MRLAIAATTLLLCIGLTSCGDDGDSKPIGPSSQACKCKPGEQAAPQLKPQVTDSGNGNAISWHGKHRGYAGAEHGSWSHDRGHHGTWRHYAAHEHGHFVRDHRYFAGEHRYAAHEQRYSAREHYRTRHEGWRERYASRPEHRWRYTERERWNYSDREYAPQPFRYDYVSRSHRSSYNYEEHEAYRDSSGPCCSCRQNCDGGEYGGGDGYSGSYRAPMSVNDPAALDPWAGYNDDNGFVDW